jgi:hypothetical protein
MHILKVFLHGIGETLMVRFKEKSSADKARSEIEGMLFQDSGKIPGPVLIEDDFGLSVNIPYHSIMLVQQIDFEKAIEGDAQWQFVQQKIGTRTLDRLKASSPIITPLEASFPNGSRRM